MTTIEKISAVCETAHKQIDAMPEYHVPRTKRTTYKSIDDHYNGEARTTTPQKREYMRSYAHLYRNGRISKKSCNGEK